VNHNGLFIGFGAPTRGREGKATEVFGEAVGLWTQLQEQGEIDSWEAVFLEPHGGDLNGFFLLRGDGEKLARLRGGDDFMRLNMRAGLVVERFGVVGAELGERIAGQMENYGKIVQELT
jgi:hypothetical protein